MDLIDNWRFNAKLARAFEGAAARGNSFRHRFRSSRYLFQALSLAQLLAQLPIAAVTTKAGCDEITDSAQPLASARVTPSPALPGFRQRTSDKRRLWLSPKPNPSLTPAGMAKMFFNAPPSSIPMSSWLV